MKQLCLSLLALLLTGNQLLHAQIIEEEETGVSIQSASVTVPKNQWFVAIGGGIAFQTAGPKYSIESSALTNRSAGGSSPFIWGKVGYRIKNKHQGAFILEKTIGNNTFSYSGEFEEGFGLSREMSYVFGNLEYSYNLLNAQRFWFGPSVQFGLGVGDTSGSAFYDRGRSNLFQTPQGSSYHKYDIVSAKVPNVVFNYGLGFNFGAEVIDDRFYIGVELRWLHSLGAIHEYEIDYQDNTKKLNFKVKSPMMNIHLGLQLAYLF
ncbi:MAG: hypothetical protein ACRBFS_01130 [Aureispira sp.]